MLETVTEDPGGGRGSTPAMTSTLLEIASTIQQTAATDKCMSPKSSKQLRKAEVLGWETRNVQRHWLVPVALHTRGSDRQHAATTQELFAGTAQLHPTYGPGQNSPQDLAALRATRMLGQLGRTAIYSGSAYIENVFETLVQHNSVPNLGPYGAPEPRRTTGRVPRRGSKAAAVRRAKRMVSQVTPFRAEVPFADAVRVAAQHNDRDCVPALLDAYIVSKPKLTGPQLDVCCQVLALQSPATQLQAVAILVREGYYFAAVKVVHADRELLRATLDEMKLIITQHMDETQWQAALEAWHWKEADKELFVGQFKGLMIIQYYQDVRRQLQALRTQGVAQLVRVEREMLIKVVEDFYTQLQEDAAAADGAAAATQGEPSSHSLAQEASAASSTKRRRAAEQGARAEAERQRQEAAAAKIREERDRREAAAAEARARAKADLQAKRTDRATARQAAGDALQSPALSNEASQVSAASKRSADRRAAAAQLAAEASASSIASKGSRRGGAPLSPLPPPAAEASVGSVASTSSKQRSSALPSPTPQHVAAEASAGSLHSKQSTASQGSKRQSTASLAAADQATASQVADGASVQAASEASQAAVAVDAEGQERTSVGSQRSGGGPHAPDAALPSEAEVSTAAGPEELSFAPPASEDTAAMVGEPSLAPVVDGDRPSAAASEPSGTQPERSSVSSLKQAPSERGSAASGTSGASEGAPTEYAPPEAEPQQALPAALEAIPEGAEQEPPADSGAEADRATGEAAPAEQGAGPAAAPAEAPGSPTSSAASQQPAVGSDKAPAPEGSQGAVSSPRATPSPHPSRPPSVTTSLQATAATSRSPSASSKAGSQRATPLSAGGASGSGRAGVEEGLAELKRAGSEARMSADKAVAQARLSSSSLGHSRASTPRSNVQELSAALELAQAQSKAAEADEKIQVNAMFNESTADEFEAEKARLAAEMAEEQQKMLEQQVAEKAAHVAALEEQRQNLHSARSSEISKQSTPRRPLTPEEKKVVAVMDAQIANVEEKLRLEKEALAALEEQKKKHELEKQALNEQLARTMQLFQEQLAHTIKMAAMLQAQRIMTGAPAQDAPQLPQMPLPQEVDEPPTEDEIKDYGRYLGMDVDSDSDLLYIAEWALTAPVPEGWTVHLDQEGHEFFYNAATKKSCYEHPMDQHYKEYYLKKKNEKLQKAIPASQRPKALRV